MDTGDYLLVMNVGAYAPLFKPRFILPIPPVISIGAGGEVEVLRRPEDAHDVLAGFSEWSGR